MVCTTHDTLHSYVIFCFTAPEKRKQITEVLSTKNNESHIMFVLMNVFERGNKNGAKIILKIYECNVESIIYFTKH